jgi:purine-nucleoside/S-methyl-5'-thioadenosine phosphorylase / adenosine deaminase
VPIRFEAPGVRVVFTDRIGGTSAPPYDSLNLGDHVGDDPARVLANRARLAELVGGVPGDPARWVWLRQVHGSAVVTLEGAPSSPPEADAAVTGAVGLPLVVLAADCAPVALAAPGAVAVVHAGWPGLEQGVLGAAVAALRAVAPGPVRAWLGPCVHPARYEFGADLLARLVDRLGSEVASTTEAGTPALDIPRAVRVSLARAGVDDLTDVSVCTAASPDHFSHRRDGVTGRQAVVVVRAP